MRILTFMTRAVAALLTSPNFHTWSRPNPTHEFVIRGGLIIHGRGTAPFTGGLAIHPSTHI